MKIAIGSDHAGFGLKKTVGEWLAARGHDVVDLGTGSTEPVDYPDYAAAVAGAVMRGEAERGVLVCGTGLGMCYVANKFHGIRAAHPANVAEAALARSHNDANVLCLAGRTEAAEVSMMMLEEFLNTPFSGDERHIRRIREIAEIEQSQ
jgi:ribose 5-phosphate isomerase B